MTKMTDKEIHPSKVDFFFYNNHININKLRKN